LLHGYRKFLNEMYWRSHEVNTSPVTELQPLFWQNIIPLIKKISKLQSSHCRNVSTDPLETGRGSFRIRGAHFGNHWSGKLSGIVCLSATYSAALKMETLCFYDKSVIPLAPEFSAQGLYVARPLLSDVLPADRNGLWVFSALHRATTVVILRRQRVSMFLSV
jgi:hypothetical protein